MDAMSIPAPTVFASEAELSSVSLDVCLNRFVATRLAKTVRMSP
jgi:hypothetical protein